MKNQKKKMVTVLSLVMLVLAVGSVSAKSGWQNWGWSNLDWRGKACNSKTKVYDTPRYRYVETWARIGTMYDEDFASNPAPNHETHAWTVAGLNNTCNYGGSAY